MRIAIVGPAHFGIAEPFAGGLESHTNALARGLQGRGHHVTVFAGDVTSPRPEGLRVEPILDGPIDFSSCDRHDNAMPPDRFPREDRSYRRVFERLANGRFDLVHNNSLHYLGPTLARYLAAPVVHTLHSPPFDWLQHAHLRCAGFGTTVIAVSTALAVEWRGIATHVVHNGVYVDPALDIPGRRVGRRAIWVGRFVPEKAPHYAIDAATRAGFSIDLYGPAQHPEFIATEIEPRLGPDVRWHGHQTQQHIRRAMRDADVGLATPRWNEPFGLTTAEMLAAGLPVAGFDRGATSEILTPTTGRLARPDDIGHLAAMMSEAATLNRRDCLRHATANLSIERMLDDYERIYHNVTNPSGAAPTTFPTSP